MERINPRRDEKASNSFPNALDRAMELHYLAQAILRRKREERQPRITVSNEKRNLPF